MSLRAFRLLLRRSGAAGPAEGPFGVELEGVEGAGEVEVVRDRRWLVVADGWLAEGDRPRSAAELVAERVRAGGLEAGIDLDGEAAVVAVDLEHGRLIASRDPSGVRPLYWSGLPSGGVALATDVRLLLALPEVEVSLDEIVVGEYLFGRFEDRRRTFFERVRRVVPGHCLRCEGGEIRQRRWWWVDPGRQREVRSRAELIEGFRERLRRAVRLRLASSGASALELSGGLDSSGLALIAGEAARRRELPGPVALSALFPGLSCDEGPYSDAVARAAGLERRTFEPGVPDVDAGLDRELDSISTPLASLQRTMEDGALDRAAELGASRLISGIGGDELLHEEAYFTDLVRHGQFLRLAREVGPAAHRSWFSSGQLAWWALRAGAPGSAKAVARRLRRRRRWQPAAWASAEFVERFGGFPEVPVEVPAFPSESQRTTWRYLEHPQVLWVLEVHQLRARERGIAFSCPYLDRQLAEYVLEIPWHERWVGGRWKRLLWESLDGLWPDVVRTRRRKSHFGDWHRVLWQGLRQPLVERLQGDSAWRAERYLRPMRVIRTLESPVDPDPAAIGEGWQLASLELWLRREHPAPMSGVAPGGSS